MEQPVVMVALLGAVILVFALIMPRRKSAAENEPPKQSMRNMEIALEQFMENMESDNRDLVELVQKAQQKEQEQAAAKEKRIAELERRCAELEQISAELLRRLEQKEQEGSSLAVSAAHANANAEAIHAAEAGMEPVKPKQSIRTRYEQLFVLHDSGKSVEAIAKKLAMNKGEVQLILQLSRQEEMEVR
ncbi:hypothetical protein [Paenibacillus sp. GCM10027626]|uniref:hypothetical protein n=1 Tax=Paenibacillus sp. GCM10027626 TaxID=3273411 RepID=UPI003626EA26